MRNPSSFFNIMHFHSSVWATKLCCCKVENGIGYDVWGYTYNLITDDFGNIVFIA